MTRPTSPFTAEGLLAAVGQAIIGTDVDGTIVYWNPAAERLYGWAAAETLGRNITDVTVPHMSQQKATAIMAALRDGTPWSGGFTVQRRDGSLFPALVTDAGMYDGAELIGIVGVSANLGSALHPLLERSSDAALVLTAEGVVSYASPAVRPLFGLEPDDLVGKPFTSFIDLDDGDLDRILYEPRPHGGELIEVRVQGPTATTTVEAALTDLRDDPLVRGVVCNLRHSERLARLQERDRISRAAHADILQSLFSVTLELAKAEPRVPAGERERLEAAGTRIREAISTLRRLVGPDADPTDDRRTDDDPGDGDPPGPDRSEPESTR